MGREADGALGITSSNRFDSDEIWVGGILNDTSHELYIRHLPSGNLIRMCMYLCLRVEGKALYQSENDFFFLLFADL